jgi:hypothetical protein
VRLAALAVCLVPVAVQAAGAGGVVVEPGSTLPFDAADVEDALAARRVEAEVTLSGDEAVVTVRASGRARSVPMAGLAGRAAARLIMLHVLDLLMVPEPLPIEPAPVPRSASRPVLLGGDMGVGSGIGDQQPFFSTIAVELVAPVSGRVELAAGAVWWHAPTVGAGTPRAASFDALGFRLRLGVPVGPVTLLAGGFVAPYRLADLTSGVTWGGSASAQIGARIAPRTRGFAELRVDAFTHQVRAVDNAVYYVSPGVAAGLALGLRWEVGP